ASGTGSRRSSTAARWWRRWRSRASPAGRCSAESERSNEGGVEMRSVIHPLRSAGAVATVLALAVAGCGSSSSSSGDGANRQSGSAQQSKAVTEARAAVKQAQAEVPWKDPGPAIDAAKAKGKTVAYIPVNSTIPFTTGLYGGFKAAMDAAGVQ